MEIPVGREKIIISSPKVKGSNLYKLVNKLDKKPIKTKDLFNRQDKHIASINSQIEEHLKRYDEI